MVNFFVFDEHTFTTTMDKLQVFVSALRAAVDDDAMFPALRYAVNDVFEAYEEARFIAVEKEEYWPAIVAMTRYMSNNQDFWTEETRMLSMLGAVMLVSWHVAVQKASLLDMAQDRLSHVLDKLNEKPELRACCPLTNAQLDTLQNILFDKRMCIAVEEN